MTGSQMDAALLHVLRDQLPDVAAHTIKAVTTEVPAYRGEPADGALAATLEQAVQMALAGFLRLAGSGGVRARGPQSPMVEGAYALGQGEARNGRSADALLAAYRVGARVAWREMSRVAVDHGADAGQLAMFAEMVFAYIDELSAASVVGHADELETTGRVRQRLLDRLGQALLRGDSATALDEAANRADWKPPTSLTALLLPEAQVGPVLGLIDSASLRVVEGLPGLPEGRAVALIGGYGGQSRRRLLTLLAGRSAIVGPARPWREVRASYARALRALPLQPAGTEPVDTEERLAELVLTADPEALADLRHRALAPLDDVRATSRDKLVETLRAWVLHQGRRDDIAAALFIHPQTVRYRMGQLRELYGDRLEDPDTIRELTLALG